jgi:hypothetical protein
MTGEVTFVRKATRSVHMSGMGFEMTGRERSRATTQWMFVVRGRRFTLTYKAKVEGDAMTGESGRDFGASHHARKSKGSPLFGPRPGRLLFGRECIIPLGLP